MSLTYAMVLDGVLRKNKDGAVNRHGLLLYNALATVGRMAILGSQNPERDDWFLKTNGFTTHSHLIPERIEDGSDEWRRRFAQVGRLRQEGANVEFVIEPDPSIAASLIASSVPVLLYIHPQYSAPSFRPDYDNTAKPWAELTKEIDYQIRLRATHAYKEAD